VPAGDRARIVRVRALRSRTVWLITALVAGLLHACAPKKTRDDAPVSSAIASAAAITSATTLPLPKKSLPPPPSFYPTLDHGLDRASENRECESCHESVATEWRASLHRDAHRDPSFVEAFALEPIAFCRNCHTPELDPEVPLLTDGKPTKLVGFAADDGIACVTCHLPKVGETGVVTAAMPTSHRPLVPRSAADDVACGGCHQFTFPDAAARKRTEWMQSTMLEHARSSSSEVSCRSCHMPLVDGHRSHRFAASRDEAMIRKSARVSAVREGEVLVLTLTAGEIGHAFPTGDLLRRLAITAIAGDPAHPLVRRTLFLGRHFGDEQQMPGLVVRVVKLDDRLGFLGPEARVLRITLAGSLDRSIAWRVAYQRVQHLGAGGAGEVDAKIGGEIVVAEGTITAK
jgi:nitrate/TMAO reductase-like tetraheme cytochrome c subunit